MTKTLIQAIEEAEKIGITGHIRPDGDCIGSTVGLFNYVRKNYPEKKVMLFLEQIPQEMRNVLDAPEVLNGEDYDIKFDLFVSLDSSSVDRLGPNQSLFENAGVRYVIDHHKTNTGFGDYNHVIPDASSCCEVLLTCLIIKKWTLASQRLYISELYMIREYSSTVQPDVIPWK